jgi:SPP1 gp7 family putative phage head morphogenesis protein
MPNPSRPQPDDDALITRALRTDSEALRYAEWWVRRRIYGLSDADARWLFDQYQTVYGAMLSTLTTAYDGMGQPIPAARARVLEQLAREMDALLSGIQQHILDDLLRAYEMGYMGRAWELDMATLAEVDVRFSAYLPREAIRAAVLAPYLGTPWHEDLKYSFEEYKGRIRRSIAQSLIAGESMSQAQRRLRDELGIQTDRRKGFTRNFYRSLLIARTEIMRASNLGALAVYEANADILSGWEWCATRSETTCRYCGALDGKRFAFGDPMLAPPSGSHPGCRCSPLPILIDTALMDRIAGVRELYPEWAARRGVAQDGGLGQQRGATVPAVNEV